MNDPVDVVIIGSGINGLVSAAYLARAGLAVRVLEANATLGGAITTEELTEPGYRHDTFSSWHPVFRLSPTYAELGDDLHARGLVYSETPDATTASISREGTSVLAYRDPDKTAIGLGESDGARYLSELGRFRPVMPQIGELLASELRSFAAARLAISLTRRLGRSETSVLTSTVLSSARGWFDASFGGSSVGDLYAPWCLHTGLVPDAAGSAFQVLAIAGSLHAVGLPVVTGGAIGFVDALVRLIEDHGGRVQTGSEVVRILTKDGEATAVTTADAQITARVGVVANVTPTQLYGSLLPEDAAPEAAKEAARFRYGRRAGMQIHVALREPLRWVDERLDTVPLVHLSDGVDAITLACAQASAGLLPDRPTIVVGQQTVIDPSRAPAGAATLWIQLQDVPYAPTGDARGELDVRDGLWTEALVAAFVERVLGILAAHVKNWQSARGAHKAISPRELEQRNRNLVRGDIYSGDTELGQAFLWRPLPSFGSHATPVDRLYHCGASTFPGPGLNGASGRTVARAILARDRGRGVRRAFARRAGGPG